MEGTEVRWQALLAQLVEFISISAGPLNMRSDRCHSPAGFFFFALPTLAFFGGAVAGRVLGLRRLLRGTMATFALGGMTAAGCRKILREPEPRIMRVRRKVVRASRRRLAQKRSAPQKP